jgi:hypothetical protein
MRSRIPLLTGAALIQLCICRTTATAVRIADKAVFMSARMPGMNPLTLLDAVNICTQYPAKVHVAGCKVV